MDPLIGVLRWVTTICSEKKSFSFFGSSMEKQLSIYSLHAGTVITILSTEQVHHYKVMLRKIDNAFVKDFSIPDGSVSTLRQKVREAIDSAANQQ